MSRPTKLLVAGWGRHGKDSFSEMLGLPFVSSSEFANEKAVWPGWGEFHYPTLQSCFDDRHAMQNRSVWYKRIKNYNTPDKARLAGELLVDNDIYCGMRCKDELRACYEKGLFDLTIWVDRSKHLPPEPDTSCTITQEMCDIVIDNNNDLIDLQLQAEGLAELIKVGGLRKIRRNLDRMFSGEQTHE